MPGVPPSFLARIKGQLNFENFLGSETSSRSAEEYITVATGGAVFSSARENPAAGDTVSRGLWQNKLTPDAVSAKGLTRRQDLERVAEDGFGPDTPTLWAARFRINSAKPTVASYVASVGGLFTFASSASPASDGLQIIFDPTIGVDAWVLRATRAGVSVDGVKLERYDNFFHTVGFLHLGTEVIPFMDGAPAQSLVAPEIQPAAGITSQVLRTLTVGASAVESDMTIDWVLWGS